MVDVKYAVAYSEVLEILKYIPISEYNKIPKEKINMFKKNASKEYKCNYIPSKTLTEQNVSKTAKGIIAILFRDYWATPEQKEKIIQKQKNDRIALEEEKVNKYNPNDIFKEKGIKIDNDKNVSLVKVAKQKWHEKILTVIKKIFNKY